MEKNRNVKLKIWTGLGAVFVFCGLLVFLFSGDNFVLLKDMFRSDITREELQEVLGRLGFKGYFTIGILSMLQVVLTFLPAEPVQVMGGIAFGFFRGSLVCLAGVFVGNTLIYALYKIYGDKLSEFFKSNVDFDFDSAGRSRALTLIVFILYFLPAIPYGLICFFAATIGMKYPRYILTTTLCSIPSILIGVGLGHIAMSTSWLLSIGVFLVLLALLVVLYKNKEKIFAKVNAFVKRRSTPHSTKTVAKRYNPILYRLIVYFGRFAFTTRLRIRLRKKVKKIEKPSIVICNHGSFIDFVYAAQLAAKSNPHFITARMYFYHRWLARLLRGIGCIPKSMFCADIETAKNCVRILRSGGTLAIFPEARLSTVGKFEGIQEATYSFLHQAKVPIYVITMRGDYLAGPKWGDHFRRGATVEGTLDLLYTAEQVKEMSFEEFKAGVAAAMDYNDFEWLRQHPELRYKSKTLAKGLENILCRCPSCGGFCTISTEGRTVSCTACGFSRTMDDRYAFTEPAPFPTFVEWYEWQKDLLRSELRADPDYALESRVTLKHSSILGKTILRVAGEGVCRLDRSGLTYRGERDGETVEKHFPISAIYRLLFGAGEDFEIYEGSEIFYFVPEDPRSAVAWYIMSELLKEEPTE